MSSAYIAIGYACNQCCSFCPCSKSESLYPFIEIRDLKNAIDEMIEVSSITHVTISGGEPTLHPDFIEFIRYIGDRLIINLLTNSEMFYKREFAEEFSNCISGNRLSVVTTIHSHNVEQHELANQTKGSFERTMQGLMNLVGNKVHVTIKHCITKENHKDLLQFYQFVINNFPEKVDLQLCSIDYCNLNKNQAENQMVSFLEITEYIEKMFDQYIEDDKSGSNRNLYCINLPLCCCDPYYWEFVMQKEKNYINYASPDASGKAILTLEVEEDVGTFFNECKYCKAESICSGTYKSAFEYFGDRIVKKYVK